MWWAVIELLDRPGTHVVPVEDLRDHDCGHDCWCKPEQDEDLTWVHRSMDGREAFENGERLPS